MFLWHKIIFNDQPTLILMDEPDRSMHIKTQRQLLPLFYKLNEKHKWGHQILYASHSPSFAASVMALHDERFIRFDLHERGYWQQMDLVDHLYEQGDMKSVVVIAENSRFNEVRLKAVKCMGESLDESLYPALENFFISDRDDDIRLKAGKIIQEKFTELGKDAVRWVLSHDKWDHFKELKTLSKSNL